MGKKPGWYQSWYDMVYRTMKKHQGTSYLNVKCCDRWLNVENFKEDMLDSWFEGAVISRKGDKGNYEPGNCTWETKSKNSSDVRKNNGTALCLADGRFVCDVIKEHGVSRDCFRGRIDLGWSMEDACTKPMHKRHLMSDGRFASSVAEENGISKCQFGYRVSVLGWSIEKAATFPIDKEKVPYANR